MSDEEKIEPPEILDGECESALDQTSEAASDERDGASAPGVPFAYDVTHEEIGKQEATIRELNSRLGFLLAITLTFGTFYFKEVTIPWVQIIVGVALFLVLAAVLLGYVPRTHLRAPNPHAVTRAANERPGKIKELALGAMLEAVDKNRLVIIVKNRWYAAALIIGVIAVMLGVVVETGAGVIHLWTNHEQTAQRTAGKRPVGRSAERIHAPQGGGKISH